MTRSLIKALALLSLIVAAPLSAQETCLPDCQQSPWGGLQHRIVVLPNGCQITVDYFTRCACNTYNDIFVHSVSPVNGDPDCSFLTTLPISQILDMATEQLLEGSPFDFPPPCKDDLAEGQCSTRWRVVKGSCWSRIFLGPIGPGGYEYYEGCSQTVCCLKPYEVCRTNCGRTSKPLPWQSYGSCPNAVPKYPPPVGGACEPVCNEGGTAGVP
ncbi:MAG TPA: hypothetical protein VKK31_18315 [Thermoanaerobaculia bacterium]|nr:hypothetical protein [Thermoanaerobaculia bacterium]